jgi:hypothetical protein
MFSTQDKTDEKKKKLYLLNPSVCSDVVKAVKVKQSVDRALGLQEGEAPSF